MSWYLSKWILPADVPKLINLHKTSDLNRIHGIVENTTLISTTSWSWCNPPPAPPAEFWPFKNHCACARATLVVIWGSWYEQVYRIRALKQSLELLTTYSDIRRNYISASEASAHIPEVLAPKGPSFDIWASHINPTELIQSQQTKPKRVPKFVKC